MKIHGTAIVSEKAKIGRGVEIGPYTIIHDNVKIGDNTVIGSHCEIGIPNHLSDGEELSIGKDSLIRSHSIFYEGSTFADGLATGHRVTVREKTIAGKNLQIGTLSDIQGHCIIGDFVRFHSNVHIGQKSKIGDFVWIFPYVVLTNDPHPPSNTLLGVTIGNYSVVATMSVILPGATIGENVLVGAHSSIKGNAESGCVYVGSPAKKICLASKIKLQDGSNEPAYPWVKHFHRGYPEEVTNEWRCM
ncbi:N-acetyltransferase [Craterilacuibacter sp. RT1T]|uniref:N-acetyltransferase n=1 Tax=Craterilacuibacter sp. RT1T TaxID=2942211 RepID=UPI0020BF5549|nr:N-acetyltransferase [Craterilacuibacter sp. RT1T]MCL6263680.1 N-acetyltransferase [Craterilacuibacter sp. RT1T]